MNNQKLSKGRAIGYRMLSLVIALTLLWPTGAARAETGPRPGATDPATNYIEWRDDEIFAALPANSNQISRLSILEHHNFSSAASEIDYRDFGPAEQHDVIGAAAGHILSADHESVIDAYRGGTNPDLLYLQFFRPATGTVATLDKLAARLPNSTDFFELAAGDLDRRPDANNGFRDEVVVAHAQASADNKYPVQVSVFDFRDASEESPNSTAGAWTAASSKIDGASIQSGAIKPVENALAVATGDFNGDRIGEIAVAYLSGPKTLTVDAFRYFLDNGGTLPKVQLIGSVTSSITQTGEQWQASLSAAAGDFDGKGKDELALGAMTYTTSYPAKYYPQVRMFKFVCSGPTTCEISQASSTRDNFDWSYPTNPTPGQIRVAAGLFKFDPANGWSLNRKELAVVYNKYSEQSFGWPPEPDHIDYAVRILQFSDGLAPAESFPSYDVAPDYNDELADTPLALSAGRFTANLTGDSPVWSLALADWTHYAYDITVILPPHATVYDWTEHKAYERSIVNDPGPTAGARLPMVAVDTDGNTVYLGGYPVHFTVSNLISTDFILEEPPKHLYWDPVNTQIVNVSRNSDFNVSLETNTGKTFSSTRADTADYSIGSSTAASAGGSISSGGGIGIATVSAEFSLDVGKTVGQDFSQHSSGYNSQYKGWNLTTSSSTAADDVLIGRTQSLDIWRYRIYGRSLEAGQGYPYMDIVLPGQFNYFEGGGTAYDWYQPRHENGNILSYQPYIAADSNIPGDLGSFTFGGQTVTVPLVPPILYSAGQTPGSTTLTFSSESGQGVERGYSHTLSENTSIKQSASVTAEVFGIGGSANESVEANFSEQNSFGSIATSNSTTSSETGITLYRTVVANDYRYGFSPVLYVTKDGTLRTTYSVDLTNSGAKWSELYSRLPDLALNLPGRFVYDGTDWKPGTTIEAKKMRGFFVRQATPDPATGDNNLIQGAIQAGKEVLLQTRVYNYSLSQPVPAGAQACFYWVEYDPVNRVEVGGRNEIACATLDRLDPLEMKTASVSWTPADGMAGTNSKDYHIYIVLDPTNQVNELYETETDESRSYCTNGKCVDPGQNNEGWSLVTVKSRVYGDPRWGKPAHVSMAKDALAAINPRGKIVSGNVQAYLGQPLQVRITVNSDGSSFDFSYVLVYDGDPEQGGKLIAGKQVFIGNPDPAGASVWFDWIPTEQGPHRLYAVALQNPNDPAPGGNIGELKVEAIPAPPGLFK